MSEKRIPAELRRLVIERARGCCEYCGAQAGFSSDPFTVDHIIPRSLGGPTNLENLAYSCFGCNQHKSVRVSASDPLLNRSSHCSIRVATRGKNTSPGIMISP
jgi:5-methylcytosine-specific restriction endonuclease McrA